MAMMTPDRLHICRQSVLCLTSVPHYGYPLALRGTIQNSSSVNQEYLLKLQGVTLPHKPGYEGSMLAIKKKCMDDTCHSVYGMTAVKVLLCHPYIFLFFLYVNNCGKTTWLDAQVQRTLLCYDNKRIKTVYFEYT